MTYKKLSASLLAIAALTTVDASAVGTANFSYSNPTAKVSSWGTTKNEVYNIAIFISDQSMVGNKIVGVRVPAANSSNITDIKGFITTELKTGKNEGESKKHNMPNVCEVAGEDHHEDGYYLINFPEPYVLTDKGVFVGYSFKVTEQDAGSRYPVAVTSAIDPNGFWVYTDRTYMSWASRSQVTGFVSAMEVIFEGDFSDVAAAVEVDNSNVLMAGSSFKLPITLINHGTEALDNFDYTVEANGKKYSKNIKLSKPVELSFGAKYSCDVDVVIPTEPGKVEVTMTIDKINGKVNADVNKSFTTTLSMLAFVPKHRVVMEEYTGLWCGYCPRGFAAMEYMMKHHSDSFIAISYHGGNDPIVANINPLPNSVSGYPACYMNRIKQIDPYYGSTGAATSKFGIEDDWSRLSKEFTPIEVKVNAAIDPSDDERITITANTQFVREIEGGVSLEFILLGNGLTDPTWVQSNYFNGNNPADYSIPEMEKFCKGGQYVAGLVFDDVALMRRVEANALKDIEANKVYENSFTFDINGCYTVGTNYPSWNPARDCLNRDDLYAVAMVVSKSTGLILNAARCRVATAGVNEVAEDNGAVVMTEYYNLAGQRVAEPVDGVYVKVDTYANGVKVSSKVMK